MNIINKASLQYNDVLPDGVKSPHNLVSNVVATEVLSTLVTMVRTSSKLFVIEGDTVTQTTVITNGASAALRNIVFKDVLGAGASFVAGSVKINGTAHPSFDPAAGFAIADLASAGSVTVEYGIAAPAALTQPLVATYSTIDYTVTDLIAGNVTFKAASNALSLAVVSIALRLVKSVDKVFAVTGTRLHYTTVITNIGTVKRSDLMFTDAIPAGSAFVDGSVKVNGAAKSALNPATGFALDDLAVGGIATVEFDVTVA